MTDKRIIKLFKSGDEAVLSEVMKKYGKLCLNIATDNTNSRKEAEECVNEALIELWHHVCEDNPRDLPAYISATVLSCAIGKHNIDPSYYQKYIKPTKGKHFLAVTVAAAFVLCLIPAFLLFPKNSETEDTAPAETTSIPETTVIIEETDAPKLESDGTPGLLYEIAENGKSACFIGFGDCVEETVRIANNYGGLPVTEMILGELRALANTENPQIMRLTDFGSEYLKHLIISDTVEVVGNEIISSCANIESVYYGKNVRDIGKNWYAENKTHQNFSTMEVSPENKKYVSINNCIIDTETKTLVRGCKGSVIPNDGSVIIIGERAFYTVNGLSEVNIPGCVTAIENRAFYMCKDLNQITLPDNLQSLGEDAFNFCNGLVSVDLNGYTVLPKAVFKYCSRLEIVIGSENITEIGEESFSNCSSLQLTLGTSLQKISKYAFLNFPNNIYYQGTKAEWDAIEKEACWAAYSIGGKLRLIICSNGGIEIASVFVNN